MRTTLTLDDDVARMLEDARRKTGTSLKQLVNDALRTGLTRREARPPARRHATKAVSLGKPLLDNVDDVAEVLAATEGERFQ